jgi:hypothetical protein
MATQLTTADCIAYLLVRMLMAHALCLARTRRYEEWSLPTGVSSQPFIPRVAVRPSLLHYLTLLTVFLSVCLSVSTMLIDCTWAPFMTVMSCHVMTHLAA